MVFSQFRSQYPQGSIITEMLSKIDGMHTFRAVIKDSDIVLTTATAVDSDLETAEDRAIKRALTILGIAFESSYGIQATLMPQISQPALKPLNTDHLLKLSGELTNAAVNEPINYPIDYQTTEKYVNKSEANEKYPEKFRNENFEEAPIPIKATKTEQFKQEPIDLSNQLSQIMVEMERVGWTKQQGKEYLQRKYKKNSRDQLSASEVFDFLEYLKSQSDTF
jgi:hypothetical protein